MIRKRLRKLLRRLIIWALNDQGVEIKAEYGTHRVNVADYFIRGASSKVGQRAIVNTIRRSRLKGFDI